MALNFGPFIRKLLRRPLVSRALVAGGAFGIALLALRIDEALPIGSAANIAAVGVMVLATVVSGLAVVDGVMGLPYTRLRRQVPASTPDWHRYQSPEIGVSAEFPFPPIGHQHEEVRGSGRTTTEHVVLSFSETARLTIVLSVITWDSLEAKEDEGAAFLDEFALHISMNQKVSLRIVDIGGVDAVEYVYTTAAGVLVTSWRGWTSHPGQPTCSRWVVLLGEGDSDAVDRFLRSFRFEPVNGGPITRDPAALS